jgi:pilus assembly protein CpaC
MIPVLSETGALNIQVAPEERIPSFQFGLNMAGSTTTIPGFTTRKTQTIVELKPGQELFISGLITANSGRELDKIPILGEVPILGALYRTSVLKKRERACRSDSSRNNFAGHAGATEAARGYRTRGGTERFESFPG